MHLLAILLRHAAPSGIPASRREARTRDKTQGQATS